MQIYFDYNASSPLAPEVLAAMQPYFEGAYGNPSSPHWAGRPAKQAVDDGRRDVAALLGAEPAEIVFTSGGTEANNHVIKGVYGGWRRAQVGLKGADDPRLFAEPPHFITSAIEHPAISVPLAYLRDVHGVGLTVVGVDRAGRVDPSDIEAAIQENTVLVTVMHSNNEVGTLQPVAEIGRICRSRGVLLHTDASQSVGKVPIDVRELEVDLLTVAGHKLMAPKGIGALYIRNGLTLEPLLHGAGHEDGRRAGTENALWIVGLGAAAQVAQHHFEEGGVAVIRRKRDRFEAGLLEILGDRVTVNGAGAERLPNTCSVNFVGQVGAEVLNQLEGVAASTGAACHSGDVKLSGVLSAMGVTEHEGMGAVRFSLGRFTTDAEIDAVLGAVRSLADRLGSA